MEEEESFPGKLAMEFTSPSENINKTSPIFSLCALLFALCHSATFSLSEIRIRRARGSYVRLIPQCTSVFSV